MILWHVCICAVKIAVCVCHDAQVTCSLQVCTSADISLYCACVTLASIGLWMWRPLPSSLKANCYNVQCHRESNRTWQLMNSREHSYLSQTCQHRLARDATVLNNIQSLTCLEIAIGKLEAIVTYYDQPLKLVFALLFSFIVIEQYSYNSELNATGMQSTIINDLSLIRFHLRNGSSLIPPIIYCNIINIEL
jgi:hypothetical protein